MSTKNYSYPRVSMSVKALRHTREIPEAEDTTNLFIPLFTPKGPSEVITRVHSLTEFIDIFGDLGDQDYKINGQTNLNLYNWLSNGGTAYVYRLKKSGAAKASLVYTKTVETQTDVYTEVQDMTAAAYTDLVAAGLYTESEGVYTPVSADTTYDQTVTYYTKSTETSTTPTEYVLGEARYYGEFYNKLKVEIALISDNTPYPFNIKVYYNNNNNIKITVDEYTKLTSEKIAKALVGSEYIQWAPGTDADTTFFEDLKTAKKLTLTFKGADDKNPVLKDELESFWETTAATVLGNRLETPIDVILDAGYPLAVKSAMNKFINNSDEDNDGRTDIIGLFDEFILGNDLLTVPESDTDIKDIDKFPKASNIALYTQFFTIDDEIFNGQDIFVTPTYFLSKLIPNNDNLYGVQWATAGIRRAILDDAKALSSNPTATEKQEYFNDRINYAEKTPREISFQNQRTYDGSTDDNYTALSFLNNARVLERMKKDLEKLGREYLFEFNDSTTLNQMSNVLNKYINQWINNRTLSKGNVTVSKNPYSDEAVDIDLVIKFHGTLENIYVSITIE